MNELDFLVYSSHKTSTQSIISILCKNNFNVRHTHQLIHMHFAFPTYKEIYDNIELKKLFLNDLDKYNKINNKKLSIISIVRNPHQRLISSFFQIYDTDEINHMNISPSETTISRLISWDCISTNKYTSTNS